MKTAQQLKMIGGTMTLTLLFAVSPFQACGPGQLMRDGAEMSSTFTEGEGGTMVPTTATKTANVTHSESVLTSLTAITGTPPSQRTMNAYNRDRTKISDTGKVDTVNAPMWIALTNLSGETCKDLKDAERGLASDQRKVFNGVDFTKALSNTPDSAIDAAIRKLARSAWARNETAAELSVIKGAMRSSFTANNGAETEKAMMFACTAVLASLETHDQ